MQFIMQVLHGDWNELLGALLIVGGLALASWTLGEKHMGALAFGRSRLPLRGSASSSARRIDAAGQWQRVVDIAESEFVRLELAAASQASAMQAVEAADAAVIQMLADCAAAFTPSEAEGSFDLPPRSASASAPAPEPLAQPLAA